MKKLLVVSFLITSCFLQAEEGSKEEVKVEKKKNGSNVYNFNFYNKKEGSKKVKENKVKEDEVQEPAPKENPKLYEVKKKKKGNRLEAGLFSHHYMGSFGEVSDLSIGLGLRVGLTLSNTKSPFYLQPGFMISNASADFDGFSDDFFSNDLARNYDGAATGAYIKIGKLVESSFQYALDIGLEGSYLFGDLDSATIFGSGNYEFSATGLSVYGGPVFKVGPVDLVTALNFGVTYIKSDESIDNSGIVSGVVNYNEEKVHPFLGLNINVSLDF